MNIRINIFINVRIIILDASKISKTGCFTLYWFILVAFSLNSFYSVTARCQQESLECRTEWILFCMNLRLVVNGLLCRYQRFLDWFIFPYFSYSAGLQFYPEFSFSTLEMWLLQLVAKNVSSLFCVFSLTLGRSRKKKQTEGWGEGFESMKSLGVPKK